jgi:hypothetical protein
MRANDRKACGRTAAAFVLVLTAVIVGVGMAGELPVAEHGPAVASASELSAEAAFTCDFGLSASLPMDQVGPGLERDRMYMAARPGFLHKHVPLRIEAATGNFLSGGRYLFRTDADAEAYWDWVRNSFILDGTKFFDRPYFINPDCHTWSVIGANDLRDIHTSQVVVRTERWRVPDSNQRDLLKARWPAVLAEAQRRGFTSVWLLYNLRERLASLVYFADRVVSNNPLALDFTSLATLESAPPLGQIFSAQPWTKTFDRTEWVLTIWFPFVLGDHGEPSLWPYSPPLPQPYSGDGVCEVSRGENAQNSPSDCPVTCGDGIPQVGENSKNCPGDVRIFG